MAVFNELLNIEKMEDPEERKAAELGRSQKKTGQVKSGKKTSVSANTYRITMFLIKLVVFLAVLGVAVFLSWYLIAMFIPM